jgi:hypothetical protein
MLRAVLLTLLWLPPAVVHAQADPARGVLVVQPEDAAHDGSQLFAYDAVMSGRFAVVETEIGWLEPEGAKYRPRSVVYRWSRAEGAACAGVSRVGVGQGAAVVHLSPEGREHDLARGLCARGEKVAQATATYALVKDPKDHLWRQVRERATDRVRAREERGDLDWPWRAFGLERADRSLWDRTGNHRRPDPVTEAELISALRGAETFRQAAVRVLEQRVGPETGALSRSEPYDIQPTGVPVAAALLASGALGNPVGAERARAIRAAAAIPAAGATLAPAVVEALRLPVDPDPVSGPAQAQRQRMERVLPGSAELFGPTGARPGYEGHMVLGSALFAGARFGGEPAAMVWRAVEPVLRDNPQLLFSDRPQLAMLARVTGQGEALALGWLKGSPVPYLEDLGLTVLHVLDPRLSAAGRARLDASCAPGTPRIAARRSCLLLAYRRGDRAVLDRLERRAAGRDPEGSEGLDAWGAAWTLLEDYGLWDTSACGARP